MERLIGMNRADGSGARRSIELLNSTAVSLISCAGALMLANRPRFWWQECFCNLALYWFAPVCVMAFLTINSLRSRAFYRSVRWISLVAQLYMIIHVVVLARPYIVFDRWPGLHENASAQEVRLMYVDRLDSSQAYDATLAELRSQRPTLLIVSGEGFDNLIARVPAGEYPVRISTAPSNSGRVHLLAQGRVKLEPLQELGFGAMPGGLVKVRIDSRSLELGLIALQPSLSKDSFESNRISSRRLASLMRASESSRVVVGSFNATPFSQLVSVYAEQVRMRSIFFGRGFRKTFDMTRAVVAFPFTNAFVSKDLRPVNVEVLRLAGHDRAAIAFSVHL